MDRTSHAQVSDPSTAVTPGQSVEDEPLLATEKKPIAGGTILGVHNLAIVMPQFIVSEF
jgi:solute carrier family 45 protein 1/2/4